jgi:putative ABC transport system substrate-binding protein
VAFIERLAQLGWIDGRNLQVEQRWTDANAERTPALAKELVTWRPDVIFAVTTPVTVSLFRETKETPIVFAIVSDPVGAGLVANLSRPSGNVTGFINVEAGMGGKWLDLVKQIAPSIKRAAIMFNPDTAPGGGSYFLGSFEVAARTLTIEPLTLRVRSAAEIEQAIDALDGTETGLVLMTDSFMGANQSTIIARALRHKIPTIFESASFAREGGLLSYGPNLADLFRRAAEYVGRILEGAKSADLPVQVPTAFDLAINLKTAKALGLDVPPMLLIRANEVIE